MIFHLQICGPVKSWKRTQNPSNGKPVAFGFCEFESAEGILRATRLLNKLSIDGQELVVCIIIHYIFHMILKLVDLINTRTM